MLTLEVSSYGKGMISLMRDLWPICRSITGIGVRQSLAIIRQQLPSLKINEVPTGTVSGDWIVPKEWAIRDAYILDPQGRKIVDFKESNLHVVSYSVPVNAKMELDELQEHLYSLPEQPNAIPYVTSYYEERWGFCMAHTLRQSLVAGQYEVRIDSALFDGSMSYGELVIPGDTEDEVLLSTYICHPSMANNELSGPCLATALATWLSKHRRKYTYRILFLPETIGAIYYINKNIDSLKKRVIAGYVLTCVGDDRVWSMLPSRKGNTISDYAADHVLNHLTTGYRKYSFLDRGSDERQYCSPGVDLPIASIMRSKYVTYPEYHTSLDDFSLVTEKGLQQSFEVYSKVITVIEENCFPQTKTLCEPKMSARGLRSSISRVGSANDTKDMMNLIAYSDGVTSLLEIAEIIGAPMWDLLPIVSKLKNANLLDIN